MKKFFIITLSMVLCVVACTNDKKSFDEVENYEALKRLDSIEETLKKLGVVNVDSLTLMIEDLQRSKSEDNPKLKIFKDSLARWNKFKDEIRNFFSNLQDYEDNSQRNYVLNELKSICAQVGIELPEDFMRIDANKYVSIEDYNYKKYLDDSIIASLRADSVRMQSVIEQQDKIIRELEVKYHKALYDYLREHNENERLRKEIDSLMAEIATLKKKLNKTHAEKVAYEKKVQELERTISNKEVSDNKEDSLKNVLKKQYICTMVTDLDMSYNRKRANRISAVKVSFNLNANSEILNINSLELFFRITYTDAGGGQGPVILCNGNIDYMGKPLEYSWQQAFDFEFKSYKTSSIELSDKLKKGLYSIDVYAMIDNQYEHVGGPKIVFIDSGGNDKYDD
ncbi:MAG: hypothetical protein J6T60_13650 [Bacteroidales bacterium]|nr:hypothetical protein [Bacteroidales bacterium]